jgi:hypothetical protein
MVWYQAVERALKLPHVTLRQHFQDAALCGPDPNEATSHELIHEMVVAS